MNFLDFLLAHQKEIFSQTGEHIGLTLVALVIAIFIGIPMGIALTRRKELSPYVLGIVGVVQTIPSVALLGFLLPFLGIGITPAIVALFLYALLPIVRNTYTGIEEVDPAVRDAGKGMGMSDIQVLFKIELPLSVPVIFAGIRTATVINIGVATLCALIGAGGLGEFIFRGIALNNMYMMLAGAIPAAILAVLFDLILGGIQRFIHQILKPVLLVACLAIFILIPLFIVPVYFDDSFTGGFTAEFMERSDGYPGLSRHYNFSINTVELDPGLMYQALKDEKVDVICGFSTDGRIRAFNFRVLEDDKKYFPPYQVAPLMRGETFRKYPVVSNLFSKLAGKITDEKMREFNFRVDQKKEPITLIAEEFLVQNGFAVKKTDKAALKTQKQIVIGSKNFTEQYILANIFKQLIENNSDIDVILKTGLAGTKICFDALLKGEIDLYPEYTGTGLHVILKAEKEIPGKMIRDENHVYDYVKAESKRRYDVEWREPIGFNNTYALMMRDPQASISNIRTISQLKDYLKQLN